MSRGMPNAAASSGPFSAIRPASSRVLGPHRCGSPSSLTSRESSVYRIQPSAAAPGNSATTACRSSPSHIPSMTVCGNGVVEIFTSNLQWQLLVGLADEVVVAAVLEVVQQVDLVMPLPGVRAGDQVIRRGQLLGASGVELGDGQPLAGEVVVEL